VSACDVKSAYGKGNCPDPVSHTVIHHGRQLYLCERCFQNVLLGAYGKELQKSAREALAEERTK